MGLRVRVRVRVRAFLVSPDVAPVRVGGHGARHARARAEAVCEGAANRGVRHVLVGAARERHEHVALRLDVVEH